MAHINRSLAVLVLNSWEKDGGYKSKSQNVQRYNSATVPTFTRLVSGNSTRNRPANQFVQFYFDGRCLATLYPVRENRSTAWRLNSHVKWLKAPVELYTSEEQTTVEPTDKLTETIVEFIRVALGSSSAVPVKTEKEILFGSLEEAVEYVFEAAVAIDQPAYWPLVLEKDRWVVDPKSTDSLGRHHPFTTRKEAMAFVKDHSDVTQVLEASIISPGKEYLPPMTTYKS